MSRNGNATELCFWERFEAPDGSKVGRFGVVRRSGLGSFEGGFDPPEGIDRECFPDRMRAEIGWFLGFCSVLAGRLLHGMAPDPTFYSQL
jgi:hypothetical protein